MTSNRTEYRRTFLTLVIVMLCSAATAYAQREVPDRILLESVSGNTVWVGCEILDSTGEKITFRVTPDGEPTSKPASQVLEVITPQVREHVEGLNALQTGDASAALKLFDQALTSESREWVKRELYSLIVRAGLLSGDRVAAVRAFEKLTDSDAKTPSFHLIPLVWSTQPIDGQRLSFAVSWLRTGTTGRGVLNLIGASELLLHPRYAEEAKSALRRLSYSSDRRIQLLAKFQELRLEVGDVNDRTLARWRDLREQLPEKLRGGPGYVIGRAHAVRQEHGRAAAMMLWVPVVFDHDPEFASKAAIEAAEELRSGGDDASALTLYREILLRFPKTESARIARQSIDQLSAPSL